VGLDVNQPASSFALVTRADGVCRVSFTHCPCNFTDLSKNRPTPQAADAVIAVSNVKPFTNKMVQVRVAEPAGRVVGFFRTRMPDMEPATFTIPGCVDALSPYDVDLYIDANDNNDWNGVGYDNPAENRGDFGWRTQGTSRLQKDGGLRVTFDAAQSSTGHVDVGPL
jgi:hypothetical protein